MSTMTCARARPLAALILALPFGAHAACTIETLELPVKMVGSRAVATVRINGAPVPLTVDSGAFFSFLTEAAASQLGLRLRKLPNLRVEGITGPIDARVTTVDKLQLLKGDIPRVEFIVGGNEPGAGTLGLMGRNLLSFTDTEYDLANGVIRFSFPNDGCAKANLAYWAGTSHVTVVDLQPEYSNSKTPALRARVKLNGAELVALLDTGAPTTVVTAGAARRAGVAEAQMKPSAPIYGGGRGSAKGWTAAFDRFEIGDEAISNNRMVVGDFSFDDVDVVLGIDFFLAHRIYVSKAQEKMFITYNGGTVFALNRSPGPGLQPPEGAPSAERSTSADQLARRAASFAARQDYDRALVDLNAAIELEPTSAGHLAERGIIFEALRRPAEALKDYDAALGHDPAHGEARFHRAVLRLRERNREGALSDLDALDSALAPQANQRLAMAGLYLELEQPAKSLAQLDQWLPAHPDQVRRHAALNSRCWARAMLGIELEQALKDCDEAIDGDGNNAAYLDSRGWVHLRLANYRRALADFDRALELRPGIAVTLYGRGLTKMRLGEAAQGEADLAAARQRQADIDARVTRAGLTLAQVAKP